MNYHNVVFETSYGKASQLGASDLVEIAFAGRSNVGKSSLINKIFNRKSLARVSAVPGKTATINFFRLENVRFADLPGYGYAKVSPVGKAALVGPDRDLLQQRPADRAGLSADRHAPPADQGRPDDGGLSDRV